jgi:hypothetical protein
MQVIETTRLPTPGGASGPPPAPHDELRPFVLAPAADDNQSAARRVAFGRRLTAARERRGVALDDIARSTKVSIALLAGLERGDASRWPKGLFRRAFFRDYAAAIGLAPDASVTEFLHLFPDGEDHPVAGTPVVRADANVTPALRLALASGRGARLSPARLAHEAVTLGAVLTLTTLLTLWAGGTPLLFLGLAALGYSGRLAYAAATRAPIIGRRLWQVLSRRQPDVTPPQS